ncbi:MAG TPA: hypothetical protein VML91_16365 [Burkholderiales bacterium]|nr:hypothetical protein [Burkholderiales bacterium]
MPKLPLFRVLAVALAALIVAGCSSFATTSLDKSWVDPKLAGTKFKKVLILSLASDEFAQQYFQDDMAAALRKHGVSAVASERFFTHASPAEDARFRRAIEQSDADAVLLARVIGVDEKTTVTGGYLVSPGGAPDVQVFGLGNVVASTWAPTRYVRPQDYTQSTVLVETVLYERKGKQAVWSARTSTKNAQSGDLKPAIAQFVDVLVNAMDRDGLF